MSIRWKARRRKLPGALAVMAGLLVASGAQAADQSSDKSDPAAPGVSTPDRPNAPTPLGIYGVNQPKQGVFSLSINPGYFALSGSLIGTQSMSPVQAVTDPSVKTTFGPIVGKPVQVRNVPATVNIGFVGFGLTYGLTKDFAVTVASAYLDKNQDVNVFKGMSGSTLLGQSDAGTQGISDTALVGLYRLYHDSMNQINVFFGFFLPTGSTTENEGGFNNSGKYGTKRAVYTLQLGTGTVDALPGITYSGVLGKWSWGLAFRGRYALDTNAQGYRWGAYSEFDGWGGYTWLPGLSTTLRVMGQVIGHIDGYDPQILGYGPCSNPLWFGGDFVDILPGLSISGRYFDMPAATASVAFDVPVYQNLNGLHTARNYGVLTGLKFKF